MQEVPDNGGARAAEGHLSRLTNLYAALSKSNEAIYRGDDLMAVCQTICEIAVTHGRLVAAAIRRYDRATRTLEPYCHFGPCSGAIGMSRVAIDDPASNAARVARDGGHYVANQLDADPFAVKALADASDIGVRAAAGFALQVEHELAGVFSVFAGEPGFFDPQLVKLLGELVNGIAFAFSREGARSALAESNDRYGSLFEALPQAIWLIRDDRLVLVNPAALRLTGFAAEKDMVGRPVGDAIAESDRRLVVERARLVIDGRKSLPPVEHVLLRADGSTLVVEALMIPVTYQGRPAALAIIQDLTERKLAEQRVRRLSSLYTALSRTNEAIFRAAGLDELCDAVCAIAVTAGGLASAVIRIHDDSTGMLEPRAYRGPDLDWFGRRAVSVDDTASRAALVARTGVTDVCNDILAAAFAASAREEFANIGARSTASFALRLDEALAGTFSVSASEASFFDDEMVGLLEEIAGNLSFAMAKLASAAALARSEARYRALFDASPDPIRVICDGTVVLLNPAGVRLFGNGPGESMIGKHYLETVAPEFRALARERTRQVIEEGASLPPSEQILLRGNGSEIVVEVTSMPFDHEGRPAVLTIIHDLTARKEIEQATLRLNAELEERVQRRTAELKRVNADLESFSYSVAHDLRAPLRSMSGFAQLLQLDVEAGSFDDVRSHVERIVHNAARMNSLIDGLLNVANAAHGRLAVEHVDMTRMVEEVLSASGARVRARVLVGPLPTIEADRASLRQVWENLVSNALKYSAKRAHPEIRIECDIGPDEAVFHIQDNGVGFSATYAEKLFGVFSRLHSGDEFEGIGIGLAIVKRVVERHGGRAWAESSHNLGATFHFSLPSTRLVPAAA